MGEENSFPPPTLYPGRNRPLGSLVSSPSLLQNATIPGRSAIEWRAGGAGPGREGSPNTEGDPPTGKQVKEGRRGSWNIFAQWGRLSEELPIFEVGWQTDLPIPGTPRTHTLGYALT